jgi:hypothetical protein
MGQCSGTLPGGINKDCLIPLSEVDGIVITDKSHSFASVADAQKLSKWTTDISTNLTVFAVAGLKNYENTTDDPTITTNPVSKSKSVTDTPVPSFNLTLDSNQCDFKEVLNNLKGGVYGIYYILKNGNILGTLDQAGSDIGKVKPFLARINAATKLLQTIGEESAFTVLVNHLNYDQVLNQFYVDLVFQAKFEFSEAMPAGLNMYKTAIYAAGDQAVQINVRCEGAYTGIADENDFEVIGSNVDTPAVTAVDITDAATGVYVLTVEKGAVPASLAEGDWVKVRVKKASPVTHLSNTIVVYGA